MINSKKIQFVIILILASIVFPVFASEPNEPNKPSTQLKFKIFNESDVRWRIGGQSGMGPIRPEFMAEFYIKSSDNIPNHNQLGKLDSLLQTDNGKLMSPGQKDFLDVSSSYELLTGISAESPIGYYRIHLYAVSQNDAEKMAMAFIEQVNKNAKERAKDFNELLHASEQEVLQYRKDLPQKEALLKEVEDAYKKIKEKTHQISSDEEAADFAKNSIIEMDRTFNDLDIELAGIEERIKSIEKYQNEPGQSSAIREKLHSMYIDLMIELSGLEAQRRVAKVIYMREQQFLSLFNQKAELNKDINILNRDINLNEQKIKQITNNLDRMGSNILPAEVYKDLITIYRVGQL